MVECMPHENPTELEDLHVVFCQERKLEYTIIPRSLMNLLP